MNSNPYKYVNIKLPIERMPDNTIYSHMDRCQITVSECSTLPPISEPYDTLFSKTITKYYRDVLLKQLEDENPYLKNETLDSDDDISTILSDETTEVSPTPVTESTHSSNDPIIEFPQLITQRKHGNTITFKNKPAMKKVKSMTHKKYAHPSDM